jgi:RES domain-containing protein
MSLAMLETLVHIQSEDLLKHRYVLYKVAFDDSLMTAVDLASLPKTWRKSPPSIKIQNIGDLWAANATSAILRVPSAVVPTEWNYLLNPTHPNFSKIKAGAKQSVQFDARLIKTPVV